LVSFFICIECKPLILCKVIINGGTALPGTGANSFKGIMREGKRFQNVPVDNVGNEIPMVDFESMPAENLERWRDHLVDSFTPGSSYTPKFRFLRKDGLPPKLTMLKIGTGASGESKSGKKKKGKKAVESGKKRVGKQLTSSLGQESVGKKAAVSKKKVTVSKGKKGRGKGRKSLSKEEASSSDSDGSDDEEPTEAVAMPRRKRKAAIKGTNLLRSTAQHLESLSPSPIDEETEVSSIPVKQPPTRKIAPGSEEGRQAAPKIAAIRKIAGSPYLQTRAMSGGTLPLEWSRESYNPSKASVFIHIILYISTAVFQLLNCTNCW
jgi:hypothetical protein